MHSNPAKKRRKPPKLKTETVISKIENGRPALETIYQLELRRTAFIAWKDGEPKMQTVAKRSGNRILKPVSPSNNLIRHRVVLLPSFVEDYGTEANLIEALQAFIHAYCDLDPAFELISTYYVILSWVYDRFRELPYLRVQGDYGTGKSRFLQVVGSLCYKPLFASGASTVSPIFHTLDMFRGTLVLDEADFRFSDEKADIVKILNNGNMSGFPLLRSETTKAGTYNPRAFRVYGPKILATRGEYKDTALESRIITRRANSGNIRPDIPLSLPDSFEKEAQSLRNRLLMYRFKNWHRIQNKSDTSNIKTSERTAQIFRPLLQLTKDDHADSVIREYALQSDQILKSSRAHSFEEHVLTIMHELLAGEKCRLTVKAIAAGYRSKFGGDHTTPVTNKWIGGILRNRLHLTTVKRNGIYVIPETEMPRIQALFMRYNILAK